MTAGARGAACCLLLATFVACGKLPEIDAGVCGNIVLESGEDCDGFASHGLACRAPGTIGACHMDCSPAADGTRTACPTGWGCDPANVCRKLTGEYRALPERVLGNAWSLSTADFDGDGRDDVLAAGEPGAYGVTKFRVHRFDRDGAAEQTWTSASLINTPVPFRSRDAERSDVVYVRGGSVGLLSGEADGSLLSIPMPSYYLRATDARVLSVLDEPIRDSAAILVLASRDGVPGLYRQSQTTERIELAAELPAEIERLAAEPLSEYLHGDRARYPCRDVALAYRDARELTLYSPCEVNALTGSIDWLDAPEVSTLALDPPDRIQAGLLSADLDGDGHLDLLVGAKNGPYAAYGDGEGFGPLQPYRVSVRGRPASPSPMPLAAGDLSGDGIADLILPDAVVLADASDGAREPSYIDRFGVPGLSWTEALIADLNRDGNLDAAAASTRNVDIDFLNGTGTPRMNPYTINTDRPIQQLAVGDFDGDFYNDLAFVQIGKGADMLPEVSIAYGDDSGAPSQAITIARLQDVRQISPFATGIDTSATHMALLYGLEDTDGEPGTALSLFAASTDRAPACTVELSSFSEDGSLSTAHALALTPGAFLQAGQTDVVALALAPATDDGNTYELWLLPDLSGRHGNVVRLGWGLAGISPLFPRDETILELSAVLAAGDLDGDGVDELLLSAPGGDGERCVLSSARVAPDQPDRLQLATQVTLDAPCKRAVALSAVDLDGDGAQDVLVLLGEQDARALRVLWGDGSGELSADRSSTLTPADANVQAFATFRTQADAPLELAYTTRSEARSLRADRDRRSFSDGGQLAPLQAGAGITAADVDGDGVTDLVVADDGALRVLHAELEAP